jgi:hypothetical protein
MFFASGGMFERPGHTNEAARRQESPEHAALSIRVPLAPLLLNAIDVRPNANAIGGSILGCRYEDDLFGDASTRGRYNLRL